MARKIPRNKDQGEQKDRVSILGKAVLESLTELKSRTDNPVFVVTSANLFQVPGVIKDAVEVEPAVTARLDNIEKMVESLTKGFSEMKAAKAEQWPAIKVNGAAVQSGGQHAGAQVPFGGARGRNGVGNNLLPAGRSKSPSVKRTAEEAQLQHGTSAHHQPEEVPWSDVVRRNQGRRPRTVQYGTAKVDMAGGEAAPYDIVVRNTNPASTDEIIKEVLKKVALGMAEDLKPEGVLEILEIECLTKPRMDESGRIKRMWTKTWRVQVPNKFRQHMLRPEAYPAGWTTRKYFPARDKRPAVPGLDPTEEQPPEKRVRETNPQQ